MPNIGHEDQRIRRSSSFRDLKTLQDFLNHASECRDQLEVYFYMEENKIYVHEPAFWLQMLKVLHEKCEYKLIIKKISQIKRNVNLREHQDFYKILEFEENLTRQLELEIRKRKNKKRRSIQQFQLFSISKIQKKKRKVGGIEIYIDQECRDNYKLEDYSDFFINNMTDYIENKRNEYQRKQQHKQWSFLGNQQVNLQTWSDNLIDLKNRQQEYPQQNYPRESMVFKSRDNDEMVSNNVSKRLSISRKSNLNLLPSNNPQSGYKTRKQSKNYQTPKKNHPHQQSNKNKQIVGTPINNKEKKYIPDQSLLKAYKKSEKVEMRGRYSSSESSNSKKSVSKAPKVDNFLFDSDDDLELYNYSRRKEIIRVNHEVKHNEIDEIMRHYKQETYKLKLEMNQDKREPTLDFGCVEWSQIEDDKEMEAEIQIDQKLKQTIFQAQVSSFQCSENQIQKIPFLSYESTPTQSMFCENDSNIDQSQSQCEMKDSQLGVLICLKSTKTLQSIDSNQQNLFSTQKQRPNFIEFQNLQAFKKDRKVFEVLPVDDRNFQSETENSSDFQIVRQDNNNDTMSLQGNNQIRQMIDQMDQYNGHHRNFVLQTLRKKKRSEFLMHQIGQDQRQYLTGTRSQKKKEYTGLKYISEQKSSYSQKIYHSSRERFSSGYFGDFS